MFVSVKFHDGSVISPMFEPSESNLLAVPAFYNKILSSGLIESFTITSDSGEVLAKGQATL
jgi:hypothetical protein